MTVSAVCGVTVTELDSKEPIVRKVGTSSTSRLTWGRFSLRKISLKQSIFFIFVVMKIMYVLEGH